MYLFILVSTFFLWIFSLLLMPFNIEIHWINILSIIINCSYYTFFCKPVWILYNLFFLLKILIHSFYLHGIVLCFLFIFHILHQFLLFVVSDDVIMGMIILEILSNNLYIVSYMMIVSSSFNFETSFQ